MQSIQFSGLREEIQHITQQFHAEVRCYPEDKFYLEFTNKIFGNTFESN